MKTPIKSLWDFKAALCASLAAGTVSLLLLLFAVPFFTGGNAGMMLRFLASAVLGREVLPPPDAFDAGILAAALAFHFAVTAGYTFLISFIIHRWGLITGILLGGTLGLCFYGINFFLFTLWLPWLFSLNHWSVALVHVIFGITAGGVYELLDEDVPGPKEIS